MVDTTSVTLRSPRVQSLVLSSNPEPSSPSCPPEASDASALLGLPARWRGRSPGQILGELLDVLTNVLHVDVVYARMDGDDGGGPVEDSRPQDLRLWGELSESLDRWLDERGATPVTLESKLGTEALRVVRATPSLRDADLVVLVGCRRGDFPTRSEVFLLTAALDQAMLAIEQARLLEREQALRSEAELRAAHRTLQAEVSATVATTLELGPMLQRCAESIRERMNATFARIWTFDVDENRLVPQGAAGQWSCPAADQEELRSEALKVRRIVQGCVPHVTNDAASDPSLGDRECIRREGVVGFAAYPLVIDGRAVGAMTVYAGEPFHAQSLQALAALADVIATGIRRKEVEQERERLIQEERGRSLALQQALRARHKFVSLVEQCGDFIAMATLEGRGLYLNSSGRALVGLDPGSDVTRLSLFDFTFPEDHGVAERMLQEVLVHGPDQREFRLRHFGTGAAIPVWMNVFAIGDQDTGQPIAFATILRDITEQKKLDALRERLLGIVGHDLRSPLAAISMAAATLAARDSQTEQDARTVARISRSCDRMGRMIQQLMDFTRVRLRGGSVLDRERVDLCEVCQDLVAEQELTNRDRTFQLNCSGSTAGQWDRTKLGEVIGNLIGNAIQYGERDRPIRIAIDGSGPDVELTVHNQGDPIPPETLPYIFDPFRRARLHDDQSHTNNLGLGLYITREIVTAHGGSIRVTSSVSEGTAFTVRLPRR